MLTSKTFREKQISYISKEKDFLNKTYKAQIHRKDYHLTQKIKIKKLFMTKDSMNQV